jgi:hypothetical protein
MAIQKCAVVNMTTNIVTNLIMADPTIDTPLDGMVLVALVDDIPVEIGMKRNEDGLFPVAPPAPVTEPPAPTLADLQAQLAALTAQIQALAGQNV